MCISGYKLVIMMIQFNFNDLILRHYTNMMRPKLGDTICCFPVKISA